MRPHAPDLLAAHVKSHRPPNLPGRLVKGAYSRMRDDGYFLQVSLTIFKYVTVM